MDTFDNGLPLDSHGTLSDTDIFSFVGDLDLPGPGPDEAAANPPGVSAGTLFNQGSYTDAYSAFAVNKKKYKPVHLKSRPIKADLPAEFRIIRDIKGDPLATMPFIDLSHIPDFVPTGRYTAARRNATQALHAGDFLWPEERRLLDYFMCIHNSAFAWDDSERGRFREDFFPPVEFPVVAHTPWVERNIPIPPGIFERVCEVVRDKINAGVYEPSNSSYRSRWFCVKKADGRLRPVHALEALNRVTIQHSGVTPTPDHLAETFGGRACGGILDLFVGYDNRPLAESSRDMTTFQTPDRRAHV